MKAAPSQLSDEAMHELLNLLGVVIANAELLQMEHSDHPGREVLEDIRDAARKAADVVRELTAG